MIKVEIPKFFIERLILAISFILVTQKIKRTTIILRTKYNDFESK